MKDKLPSSYLPKALKVLGLESNEGILEIAQKADHAKELRPKLWLDAKYTMAAHLWYWLPFKVKETRTKTAIYRAFKITILTLTHYIKKIEGN